MNLRAAVVAAIEVEPRLDLGGIEVAGRLLRESEAQAVESPPDAPWRYSSPPWGGCPVSASCQVERIKSDDQRGSPRMSAVGLRISERAWRGQRAMQLWSVLAHSGPMQRWSCGRSGKR